MTNALAAIGTLLKIGDGATPTEAFTTIAEVNDISGPEFTMATEDVTSHSSTGGYMEYIPTLKDGGDVTFDLNFYGHTTHTALWTDFEAGVTRNFQIVFPDVTGNGTLTFAGIVTKIGHQSPVKGVQRRSVTIKVTGQGTWSA